MNFVFIALSKIFDDQNAPQMATGARIAAKIKSLATVVIPIPRLASPFRASCVHLLRGTVSGA